MTPIPGLDRLTSQVIPWFQAYRAEEPVAGAFRARQLQAVLRLTPLTLAANLLNVLLVAAAFWTTPQRTFVVAWGVAVCALVTRGLQVWLRSRHRVRQIASARALRRATLHAALLAVVWAMVPQVLFPGADGAHQLLVATITTGMMCAGGFALATTPLAGSAFVGILGGSAALALFRSNFPLALPVGGLLVIYCVIVLTSVWATARLFGARLMAEAEAERQNEVIGLLLRDFEENASDLLWETDAAGHLCHVSPRLLSLFRQPLDKLIGRPAIERLQQMTPDDEAAAAQMLRLRQHIEQGTPFRDLTLAVTRGRRTRWWSLSAKPLRDAQGRCTGWRGVGTDVTDAHSANRQLTWLAHYDPLTGLANRHHFRTQLAHLLTLDPGSEVGLAVVCLDLDHFKTINDTLGHAVGDGLLQEVAKRLLARTRRTDIVARLGGDEFAVILREVSSADEVAALTRRLLDGLQTPCEVQGARIAVRASMGIALAPRDGTEIDALLNNADLALYAAKSAGRGESRFFAPQMAALTRRRLLIEQALRQALPRNELALHFQPQLRLSDNRVTGFEALLRWHHPELGDVPPAEFVPVAEEAGLIIEIGSWVLDSACREAMRWPAELTVSVNVSPVQAMSADLCQVALQALRTTGLAPGRLELEITESIFLNETQATMDVLRSLREAGLRVALDDFGTGYSSLAYLRRFPFDTMKIDRSFVRELLSRRDARAIVRMIIGLAHTLNMKAVAEGVEEVAQAAVLRRYGCDAIQGFLAARPMRADAVAAFLHDLRAEVPAPWPEVAPTAPLPLGDPMAGTGASS
jgi:diguanylate cyclase (GGDEF)-like protein/PAS domain S-box-containing protein